MYQLAKGVLRRFSTMRSYKDKLIFFYWWLLFQLRNSLSGSKVAPRDAGIDPSRSYQVTPESIRVACLLKPEDINRIGYPGDIASGDWDLQVAPLDESITALEMQECGREKPSMTAPAGMNSNKGPDDDEIKVHVGRSGDLLLCDGLDTLRAAKALQRPSVTVRICRRHTDWVRFRQEILDYASHDGGRVYQPILHPDLADIPSIHNERRWALISDYMQEFHQAKVLDVGANWGYFSQRFIQAGCTVTAVEQIPRNAYFLRKLARAQGLEINVFEGSIFDYPRPQDYEIVLGLNIFHHFLKEKWMFRKFRIFLKNLRCHTLFFQPHLASEPQMRNVYRNFPEAEFVEFIQEHADLPIQKYLGKDEDGRSLYLLSRVAADTKSNVINPA